jgi:hypothetical protein
LAGLLLSSGFMVRFPLCRRWGVAAALLLCECGHVPEQPDAGAVDCSSLPIGPGATTLVSTYAPGLVAASPDGGAKVALLESDPAPPPLDTLTTWTLEVMDGQGNPLPEATVSVPYPFMPYHFHNTNQIPSAQADGNGKWTVSNLLFFMPGVWNVQVDVTTTAGTSPVNFYFCVD